MKRLTVHCLLVAGLALAAGGCQESRGERSYVQTNYLQKAVLEGEWYYLRTVIDHNYESSMFTFRGDESWAGELGTIERIRWIVDEDYLYAVRTYELIAGGNSAAQGDGFLGEPVAAFPIESHFDIIKDYNRQTGETGIVAVENSSDRHWYDREYMRVKWESNAFVGYYWASLEAYETYGYVTREPAAFLCDEGSECPADWRLAVEYADECPAVCRAIMRTPPGMEDQGVGDVRACATELGVPAADLQWVADNAGHPLSYADLAPWMPMECRYIDELVDDPASGDEPPYYVSFVTQELWSPAIGQAGQYCNIAAGVPCTSFRVAVRNTFLRSGNVPDYEPINVKSSMWDKFGIIRMSQSTYARGSLPDEEEGLSRDYGQTDALNYWGARHDIWANDLNVGSDGRRIPGSYRDVTARSIQPIDYYMTPHFPPYLVEPAMQAAWQWNVAFMNVVRAVRGIPTPEEDGPEYRCSLYHGAATHDAARDPHTIDQFGGSISQFDAAVAYNHRFEGPECMIRLHVNPCDVDSAQPCVDLGDFRYHFWAWIQVPDAPFSGVSLPIQDPRNGRLVSANVNITQDSIEYTSTSALVELGMASPEDLTGPGWDTIIHSEDEVMSGVDKRAYFENRGKVDMPVTVAPIGHVAAGGRGAGELGPLYDPMLVPTVEGLDDARRRLEALEPKLDRLRGTEGRAMTFSNRVARLAGTDFERTTLNSFDTLVEYADNLPGGLDMLPSFTQPTEDAVLDAVSPFRVDFHQRLDRHRRAAMKQYESRHCFFPGGPQNPYIDHSLTQVARELGTYTPAQVALELRRRQTKWVYLHEFGHSVGMEHNFGASADYANYHDEYYRIAEQYPLPDLRSPEYETCSEEPDPYGDYYCWFDREHLDAFQRDYDEAKRNRELAGIDRWHFSSVLDYPPELYNYFHGLGKYDKAFALFSYGNRVEVYEGDPRLLPGENETTLPVTCTGSGEATTCTPIRRLPFVYYLGGQSCESDRDCPYTRGTGLLPAAQEAVVFQRCVDHYRERELGMGSTGLLPKVCSNFHEDWTRYINSFTGLTRPPNYDVRYRNCGNSRVNDISWCSMFDEGASFREVVSNLREFYHRIYPLANFRRYRASWQGGTYWFIMDIIGKMYQHFFYRWFYEGGDFQLSNADPTYGYGWWDQFLASGDALNFLSEIITTPDVGSYERDPFTNSYIEKVSGELGESDLDIPVGLGKYMWSAYETGHYGYFRQARQGIILDKIYAMLALVLREWGLTYGMDERYYFNFYDMFTVEMNTLFTGLMLDNPYWYSPRMTGTVADPHLSYVNFFKGLGCGSSLFGGGFPDYCNPDPRSGWAPTVPAVGGSSNVILRNYATAFALAEFPVFFDTSYEQQLYVAVWGGGDFFEIPGCDPEAMIEAGLTENDACVIYYSDRLHKAYVAANIRSREPWQDVQVPLAFGSMSAELLREMSSLQGAIRTLGGTPTPAEVTAICSDMPAADCLSRAQVRLYGHESFLLNLIEMMHRYGISSWF
jgi:hypothetical protein